ncbi:MAG: DUF4304 domain-containing protein [Planctomycetales bacterium]
MEFLEMSYLMFQSPGIGLDEAGVLLEGRGFDVEGAKNDELRCECNDIVFLLSRHEGPDVQHESAMIGDRLNNPTEIEQCDCRFQIGFYELEKVLDEINSLIEIQTTLQDATNAYLFNVWNECVQPPDSLKHQQETTEFPINSVREIAKEVNKVTKTWGFKRSGNNFRGVVGDAAVVLNLQTFSGGESFCMNTGVIPLAFCEACDIDPAKLSEPSCTFRTRDLPFPGWAWRTKMGPRTIDGYTAALQNLKEQTIDPEAKRARSELIETVENIQIQNRYEVGLVVKKLEHQQNFDAAIALASKIVVRYKELASRSKPNGRHIQLLEWEENRLAKLRERQATQ